MSSLSLLILVRSTIRSGRGGLYEELLRLIARSHCRSNCTWILRVWKTDKWPDIPPSCKLCAISSFFSYAFFGGVTVLTINLKEVNEEEIWKQVQNTCILSENHVVFEWIFFSLKRAVEKVPVLPFALDTGTYGFGHFETWREDAKGLNYRVWCLRGSGHFRVKKRANF